MCVDMSFLVAAEDAADTLPLWLGRLRAGTAQLENRTSWTEKASLFLLIYLEQLKRSLGSGPWRRVAVVVIA